MLPTVIPKKWEYDTEFVPDALDKSLIFRDLNWSDLIAALKAAAVKHIHVEITEIVDWDMSPMRRFFHAIILPSFLQKISEAYTHPEGKIFSKNEVKAFLKARHLGFVDNDAYKKFKVMTRADDSGQDILAWLRFAYVNDYLKEPISVRSTTDLSAVEYWEFLNACEADYYETYNDMWDKKTMPIKVV